MGTTLLISLLQIRFGLKLSDKCYKNFSLPDPIVKQISIKEIYKTQGNLKEVNFDEELYIL